MKVKYVLVVKSRDGTYVVDEHEIYGDDAMQRALSATTTLIQSWVIRDRKKFVSLTITSHE
jgi:hypothetical protein